MHNRYFETEDGSIIDVLVSSKDKRRLIVAVDGYCFELTRVSANRLANLIKEIAQNCE